jgi:hypothetical protein
MPIVFCGPPWLVVLVVAVIFLWRYTDPKRRKPPE